MRLIYISFLIPFIGLYANSQERCQVTVTQALGTPDTGVKSIDEQFGPQSNYLSTLKGKELLKSQADDQERLERARARLAEARARTGDEAGEAVAKADEMVNQLQARVRGYDESLHHIRTLEAAVTETRNLNLDSIARNSLDNLVEMHARAGNERVAKAMAQRAGEAHEAAVQRYGNAKDKISEYRRAAKNYAIAGNAKKANEAIDNIENEVRYDFYAAYKERHPGAKIFDDGDLPDEVFEQMRKRQADEVMEFVRNARILGESNQTFTRLTSYAEDLVPERRLIERGGESY